MFSDGIQKSAGKTMTKVLGLMTQNRFIAVFTGMLITMIVQSSSVTTVMVVSFVNAGLITLSQSVGVIFGANIGTTITAWIVALLGFKFKIALFAVPVFGLGYIFSHVKKIKKENLGETLMGFGLLFLGLDLLGGAIPSFSAENVTFVSNLQSNGALSLFIGVVAGVAFTLLLHSSSASTAVILTLSVSGLLQWEFAATMILGSNIGTTIDAVLASIGTKVNARRAALVHVLFNVTGTVVALIFLHPLLLLVDSITPGTVTDAMPSHIAMLHTVFNVLNTLVFLPFTRHVARLTERLIKIDDTEELQTYSFPFITSGSKDSLQTHIVQVEQQINLMISIAMKMFSRIKNGFTDEVHRFAEADFEYIKAREEYVDQMQEELSDYLVKCSTLQPTNVQSNTLSSMIRIVSEIEMITDECQSLSYQLVRSLDKKMKFKKEDFDKFDPYVDLVHSLLDFVKERINKSLTSEEMEYAKKLEDEIDDFRKKLKKIARKRLEAGENVKSELLYIDMVRTIEKIGDHAFSISEAQYERQQF